MHHQDLTLNFFPSFRRVHLCFLIFLSTKSDYFSPQHYGIGSYNWGKVCLPRGADWIFKYISGSSSSFYWLWDRLLSVHFGLHRCNNAAYVPSSVTALINLSLAGNIRPAKGCFVARGNVWNERASFNPFPGKAEIKAEIDLKTNEVFIYGGMSILLINFVKKC
jgi:hypothetical protein